MDCAIGLFDALMANPTDVQKTFAQYEKNRRNPVEMIQYAASVSLEWFENMDRNNQHPFHRFAFGCMTRSKKVTYENLRLRDKSYTDKVLEAFQNENNFTSNSPAFTPFQLRELQLPNRVMMASMGQYSAENGLVNDWHFQHYTSRAIGGVGLIMTEMTAVSETGRITLGCTGIYNENQIQQWKKITDFIHANTGSKVGIQLGHSGRKGAIKKPWEGINEPIEQPWQLLSASAISFNEKMPIPKEMTTDDMNQIVNQFVSATQNAEKAGFDMIELQAHHGFLLASFLSPLTNKRTDKFGGSIENRLRFPLRVFTEIRKVFPQHKPIAVRISACDWVENGISQEDVITIAKAFKNAGTDIIDVSTGNTVEHQQPQMGRMWQTPFSDMVRNTVHIPTITAGNITDIDQINTIILSGKADIVSLGKPLLLDPYFVRKTQAYEQFEADDIATQYHKAIPSFYSAISSERKQTENMKRALKPKSNKK